MENKQAKEVINFILGISQSIIYPEKKLIDELSKDENTIIWLFIHIEALTRLQQRELASTLVNVVAKRLTEEGKIVSAEGYLNRCNDVFSKIHGSFISAIDPLKENPPMLEFREILVYSIIEKSDRTPSVELFKNTSEAIMIFSVFKSFINMYEKFFEENKVI